MIEFFSGSGIMAETFAKHGYETLTIDNNQYLKPDITTDILKFDIKTLNERWKKPKVLWFGVPCQKFSIANSSNNFTDFMPNNLESCIALGLVYKCFELIEELKPEIWFIENPMGYLRKFPVMLKHERKHLWYCRYGDKRAKPTDVWTNRVEWIPKKCRNNNSSCHHEISPRGTQNGTQGLNNAYLRGVYPENFCEEVVMVCEGKLKEEQKLLF